jgi:hypothetical protein
MNEFYIEKKNHSNAEKISFTPQQRSFLLKSHLNKS